MKVAKLVLVTVALVMGAMSFAVSASGLTHKSEDALIPRYAHIFLIVEENKNFERIVGSPNAPNLTKLAREYGLATNYFAVTHPSEPNYVALVGGYTFGIRDDDAFYCVPNDHRRSCSHSARAGYVPHTIDRPSLASQLEGAGLSWKNYNESIPKPGSLAVVGTERYPSTAPADVAVYASKHSGFINFRSVQVDPHRASRITNFKALMDDLASGDVPNFSLIIPNLCDEMHGTDADDAPADCKYENMGGLIWRGDRNVALLVSEIQNSSIWSRAENDAIVITFDEDDGGGTAGCCGTDPHDPSNAGGGHIATIVITNHGPRHVTDRTPYSHYSLLRTIEDAFGLPAHLMRAGAPGVHPMVKLFAVSR